MSLDLSALAAAVDEPGPAAADLGREALAARLARPGRALLGAGTSPGAGHGDRLAAAAVYLAATQDRWPPRPPAAPHLIVVAADRGDTAAGMTVGAATATQVADLREGRSVTGTLLAEAGIPLVLHTVAVPGAQLMAATSEDEVEAAMAAGRDLADAAVDTGADLLLLGHLGAGGTAVAAALVCLLTEAEPATVTGGGTVVGLDDDSWARKVVRVRDTVRRARPRAREPIPLLAELGATDLAVLAGLLLGAAARRTPVLLDGTVVLCAALLARQVAPLATGWWQVAHRCSDPTFERALRVCALEPLLDLGLRGGDGAGALLALPLLRAAGLGLPGGPA